ncbi:ATP synthase F0 subunit B [Maridesulfovibrio hydrothermalis]|uniref:H+transporting two-sector ATPase B/B' subunit n=1 Tax=Maridesulfovibrio hydrothermalis AM13 = DSM 14728 TaxID=1121451 RepID=L0R9A9_9BACT|nr:ATP synthase F0 subunit B [Maridesulfovibrio hydrothermalis]CCO23339.1 H+transporting two-sector ATPase B/B' subunit [Maridesulfovibrio hydrothermalis AM13 = DSM 14728]
MIDLDISFFIQLANFIITLLVLNLLMFRPIREIIRKRGELMSDQLSKVENFTGQASSKVKDYEAALDSARKEGMEIRNNFKDQGAAQEQALLAEAGKVAATTMKAAREEVASDKDAAMKVLDGEVEAFAQKVTAKVLG